MLGALDIYPLPIIARFPRFFPGIPWRVPVLCTNIHSLVAYLDRVQNGTQSLLPPVTTDAISA